ncbi:MAG: hypothetical protein PHE67_14365 [Campylobacterales bacterium]|nr:hypothetical protein [Campylobacterales bacterium]
MKFTKVGRSFYICKDCVDSKQLTKKLPSFLKIPKTEAETTCVKLKEIVFDGRQ